jgi:hypothetical protein
MSINSAIKDIYRVYGQAESLTPDLAVGILRERGWTVPEDVDAQELVENALHPANDVVEKYGRGSPYEAL